MAKMEARQGVSAHPTLGAHPAPEEIEDFFRGDTFAFERTGCRVVEGWEGHGVAEMEIHPYHRNAEGRVMGGAVFTLADYAFAIASMCGASSSVSLTSTIEFMRATKGERLTATCDVDRSGRSCGFYTTEVRDDLGERIAKVVTTCYHPSPAV